MNKPLSSMVRIQKARTTLLLDHPFFGTLLFRLGAQARSSIATMATDGVSLYFNPQFEEFSPRTQWSLANAFTSAFKELDPIPQFKATAKLAPFLGNRPQPPLGKVQT